MFQANTLTCKCKWIADRSRAATWKPLKPCVFVCQITDSGKSMQWNKWHDIYSFASKSHNSLFHTIRPEPWLKMAHRYSDLLPISRWYTYHKLIPACAFVSMQAYRDPTYEWLSCLLSVVVLAGDVGHTFSKLTVSYKQQSAASTQVHQHPSVFFSQPPLRFWVILSSWTETCKLEWSDNSFAEIEMIMM